MAPMITTGIANASIAVTSALFTMSLASGVALFVFYSVIALSLSGYLVAEARKN
jgi:hypothetical protein